MGKLHDSSIETSGEAATSITLLSKYLVQDLDDKNVMHAYFRRCKLTKWQYLWFTLGLSNPKEGAIWIRLKVEPMETEFEVDAGATRMRPTNLLDENKELATFVNPFIQLYQDNFWFWSSYEIIRRLALTSFVVIVRIIMEDVTTLYIVMLSFISFAIQSWFTPFKEDGDDFLAFLFNANEFIVALALLCEENWAGDWSSESAGVGLTGVISLLALYSSYLLLKRGGVTAMTNMLSKRIFGHPVVIWIYNRIVTPITRRIRNVVPCWPRSGNQITPAISGEGEEGQSAVRAEDGDKGSANEVEPTEVDSSNAPSSAGRAPASGGAPSRDGRDAARVILPPLKDRKLVVASQQQVAL